jgi:aldose 1-epimerase
MTGTAWVRTSSFGRLPDGREGLRTVLTTPTASAALLSYGAALQSLTVPDRHGRPLGVVLGLPDLDGYLGQDAFLGAVVGRVANRISGARFTQDGVSYRLPRNEGPNILHGGPEGFHAKVWDVEPITDGPWPQVRLHLVSPDGDQGFPARLEVTADYLLEATDPAAPRLWMRLTARNTEPAGGRSTPVNLAPHPYLNLGGEGSGSVDGHVVALLASRYTPLGVGGTPSGVIAEVDGTPLDLRTPTELGPRLRTKHEQLVRGHGLDHNWVLDVDAPQLELPWPGTDAGIDAGTDPGAKPADAEQEAPLRLALQAGHPGTGVQLELWTDRPGLQLYTGNAFDGTLAGHSGRLYRSGDGFAAEPQAFPDTPNHPSFGSIALAPQQVFRTTSVFAFSTR